MNKPSNQAFTVIEMLIVVTITSVLFVGIFSTYLQIQKLLNSQSQAAVQGRDAEILFQTLSHDILNLVYEEWNKNYFFIAQKQVIGGSRIDYLNFISGSIFSNPSILQSRIHNVTYFGEVSRDDGKITLYRKEDMFVDYRNKNLGVPVPVLSKVSEFRVEFSESGQDWLDAWDVTQKKKLPPFIRIHVKYEQPGDESSPEKELLIQASPGIIM